MEELRNIPFGKPVMGEPEQAAVLQVMAGGILVHGPKTEEFEQSFAAWTGAPQAVAVSSCTAGMHLVYFALGIGAGDEVIVPAQTHAATAHAVELAGARAVFVDAESATGNIDVDAIAAAVTPRTRAIAVVHYLGVPVDMEAVNTVARRHGLLVVEDCALAVGTRIGSQHAGLSGDVGCFSFYPVKHMTTAEGGIVLTRDAALAQKLKLLRAFGVDRHMGQRATPGEYDVVALGFNYRMSEIEAAIGIEQVKRLDGFLTRRRANYRVLRAALARLKSVELFSADGGECESAYCLSMLLPEELAEQRKDIIASLKAQGVGTSIYYPRPVPAMTYYREKYGTRTGDFPVAERISRCSIALPVGPHLAEDDMSYIATAIERSLAQLG